MASNLSTDSTLLDAFLSIARSNGVERNVIECGDETWTYGDLDAISTGLALELHQKYGPKPVVAVVSENHPYVLATLLATWKLGGVFAPLDYHVPREILERMLHNVAPTCVLVPSTETVIQAIVKDLSLPILPFDIKDTTVTALSQKYLDQAPRLSSSLFPTPTLDDIALYLHTSSASTVSNVKCVPISHKNIITGSQSRLSWFKKVWPQQDFNHLRVLGWSPWSHIIGLSHDIGAATFLSGGCYIFGVIPSAYPTGGDVAKNASRYLDVPTQLLSTAIAKKATAFAGVPWVLEGFMKAWKNESDETRRASTIEAIKLFKVFGSGGAATSAECIEWAKKIGLPVLLDLGMTEVGGPLFHSNIHGPEGWFAEECLIPGAELSLIDEQGNTSTEGELVIKSDIISKGYLRYDVSNFTIGSDGVVTFKTGDIYGRTAEQRLVWKGRKEDFIQMSSGESIDPRVIEAALDQCPAIVRSCVVGNNFLKTSSQFICAIVEPATDVTKSSSVLLSEITRAIASANRGLAPPLRISWSRVLVLKDQQIPVTKKGAVFRKKLEDVFGDQLASLISGTGQTSEADVKPLDTLSQGKTKDQVSSIIANIVVEALRISADVLENNAQATFAELGMDSAMATTIVNNLNRQLNMGLPLNTCHTYVDLVSLTKAIHKNLGLESPSTTLPSAKAAPRSELKEDIVIVGQAVRLPGDISNAEGLWKALIDQRDDIMTPIPEARWDHKSFYRSADSKDPPGPCDITLDKAGFVDLAGFDHSFFGISSAEAFHVSPNIRLSMEIAFEALENANIPVSKIKGSNMGVFVAAGMDEGYIKLLFLDKSWGAYTRFYGTGVATSTACGRISYLLDVHGPSFTVDTACSSGLIVFDHAVQYLQSGQGESAIVCGANTHTWPGTFGFLSAQKMTSSNSRCATFTNEADGYVPSEGAAGLILKTKSAAIRDGDNILAVVRSTDVKHDGRSQGLVAPNVKAQIAMQISLLEKGNLAPSEIDFIEAHGTGTSLGDLIEIEGINEVFQSSHGPENPLVVGAAKSCVGHAETVSGLVGVIKTLGSFAAGTVPGLVQLTPDNMNPSIDCSVVPLHIPTETVELKKSDDGPLRAMILSNGFAGSIAGAVLEAPTDDLKIKPTEILDSAAMMFVVSGKSQEALLQYLNNYLDFCLDADPSLFHSVCYTSCVGREHYRYRFACVVTDMQDLIARLEERIAAGLPVSSGNARRILMGFPGQGSQYQGMGRYLANQYSGFKTIITDAANRASALTGYAILPFLIDQSAPRGASIDQSEIAQICIFIFQYSVCTWLESIGVHSHAVMGHSLGEIAAAVIARAFTFEVGVQFVVVRANLLRADPAHPGGMAAVAASEEKVARYISKLGLEGRVAIAVYNGPEAHVVSGEMKGIEKLISAVKVDGLRATKLVVDQGFHSPSIAPALPALKAWLDEHEASFNALEKPFFSTVRGKEIAKHEHLKSEYWVNHTQNSVKFVQAARAAHKSSSIDVILDVGPQPTVWSNMQTPEFSEKSRLALTGKKGKNQIVALLSALSSLFEKGFSVEFSELFSQMPHKFTFTQLPTYPFQRLHNYPSYVASRNSLHGVGPQQIEPAAPQKSSNQPEFIVDQPLCDFLDLHRIEGRRVLPGAAMVDFFARSSSSKAVKSIRFHLPLVLETPETQARAEIDSKGSYSLTQNDAAATKICSGAISENAPVRTPKKLEKEPEAVPSQMMSKAEIYECFKNVQFGEPFRTVQEVRIWSDHADADIKVSVTENPAHDRIRKLDACLHMFGAIASRIAPEVDDSQGAFLPTSLDDFTLHSNDIPADFTCRYYLPLEVERNGRLLSVSFEVFSHTGELLVSCRKYSVAWVPRGVVIQEEKGTENPDSWLRNGWTKQILPAQEDAITNHNFDELLYVGSGTASRVLRALSASAKDTVSISLGQGNAAADADSKVKTLAINELSSIPTTLRGRDVLIVLDLTASNNVPDSNEFSSLYLQVLSFMKFIMTCKLHITSLVALTTWSAPVDLYREGLDLFSNSQANPLALAGAIVQGMLRVFRRETGLDHVAWVLDLPNVESLSDAKLQSILTSEIQARHRAAFADTFVSYREDSPDQTLSRLVPTLERIDNITTRSISGTTVIVGMGSIGSALAVALVAAGCNKVVFFGRRQESNPEIIKELSSLPASARSQCVYQQVDVCDLAALKTALGDINSQFGGVKNIVHTAAVVKDTTIATTNPSDFQDVLRPKVIGSWNLHVASQDLKLELESFVLFSSTNVLVGNPGQIAYVSANSFMDSLATYRHNSGLPAASLQLGAWESKLTDNIDMNQSFAFLMKHDEGIPLIMKAMMVPIPLQVIARMDAGKLSATAAYAKDPFFAPLLPTKTASSGSKPKRSAVEANKVIVDILRVALELQPNERLDTAEPLTSCGADSITFAQFKGEILKELEVDVPVAYLSDTFTISDMINNILESYGLPPNPQ